MHDNARPEGPDLDGSDDVLRKAARHLAAACHSLALRSGCDAPAIARYDTAADRFRSLAIATTGVRDALAGTPVVGTADPKPIFLVELLAGDGFGRVAPPRGIDPDLVTQACHLLCGIDWRLPAPLGRPSAFLAR